MPKSLNRRVKNLEKSLERNSSTFTFWAFIFYFPIFFAGLNLTLPLSSGAFDIPLPFWATRISVFDKILLQEVLFFFAIIAFFVLSVLKRKRLNLPKKISAVAFFLMVLAVLSAITAISYSLFVWHDLGRSARLAFNAILLLFLVQWPFSNGRNVLMVFALGLFCGGLINLYFSFDFVKQVPPEYKPLFSVNIFSIELPKLLGQNNCGPGLAVLLVLIFQPILAGIQSKTWKLFLFFSRLIAVLLVLLSFSKVAMSTLVLLVCTEFIKRLKKPKFIIIFLSLVLFLGFAPIGGGCGSDNRCYNNILIEKLLPSSGPSTSMQERLVYHFAVAEIMAVNPFGVSFSGFLDSYLDTDFVKNTSLILPDESTVIASEANPHSTILYYSSANGLLGFVFVVLILFYAFHLALIKAREGCFQKLTLFVLLVTYSLTFLSVPYGLNSLILLIPLASIANIKSRSNSISSGF